MKQLKVYGFNKCLHNIPPEHSSSQNSSQKRVVIATTSWKKAAELTGMSVNYIRKYGSITGNSTEIAHCLKFPNTPFYIFPDYCTVPSNGFFQLPK